MADYRLLRETYLRTSVQKRVIRTEEGGAVLDRLSWKVSWGVCFVLDVLAYVSGKKSFMT